MDAASTWLSRQLTKALIADEELLTRTLTSGGVEDRYQFICGQISILHKVAQWIKEADPDERPTYRQNLTQEVY